MMLRTAPTVLLFSALVAGRVRAQGAAVGIGMAVSYGVLGVASVARLLEGGRTASVGDSLRLQVRRSDQSSEFFGRATAVTADSLTLQVGDSSARFAQNELSRAHMYSGEASQWAQGWAIGFTGGMLIGAGAGYINGGSPPECEIICLNREQTVLILGVFGAVSGSLVGAAIGSFVERPHWRPVDRFLTSAKIARVGFTPIVGRQTGIRLGVTF